MVDIRAIPSPGFCFWLWDSMTLVPFFKTLTILQHGCTKRHVFNMNVLPQSNDTLDSVFIFSGSINNALNGLLCHSACIHKGPLKNMILPWKLKK